MCLAVILPVFSRDSIVNVPYWKSITLRLYVCDCAYNLQSCICITWIPAEKLHHHHHTSASIPCFCNTFLFFWILWVCVDILFCHSFRWLLLLKIFFSYYCFKYLFLSRLKGWGMKMPKRERESLKHRKHLMIMQNDYIFNELKTDEIRPRANMKEQTVIDIIMLNMRFHFVQ